MITHTWFHISEQRPVKGADVVYFFKPIGEWRGYYGGYIPGNGYMFHSKGGFIVEHDVWWRDP